MALFKSQREIEQATLSRFASKDGLVGNFSSHHKPLSQLLAATEKNIRLTEALRTRPKKRTEPWVLIAQTARVFNERLTATRAEDLAKLIMAKAKKHGVDPLLMTALISQESAFYPKARSSVGAYGYGQLMPGTADFLGVNRKNPEENLEGCAKYLGQHLRNWRGHPDAIALSLASYNAGPGAVAKYKGVPPYRETRNYVFIVNYRYEVLKQAATQKSLPSKLEL